MKSSAIFFSETLGTGLFVFMGCGVAVLAGSHVGTIGVAFAFGLSYGVLHFLFRPLSGGHLNPAVSISLFFEKELKSTDLPIYVTAQLIGSLLGSGLLFLIASGKVGFDVASGFSTNGFDELSPDGYNLTAAAIAEIVLTAIFVMLFKASSDTKVPRELAGFVLGFTLFIIVMIGTPVTNLSINPARSLGVAFFQGGVALTQLWLFMVAPVFGSILGVSLHSKLMQIGRK